MAKSIPTPDDTASQLNNLELVEDAGVSPDHEAEPDESREETICYAESDIPQFIDSLNSKTEEGYQKGTEALTSITINQPELLAPHIPTLIPSLLDFIPKVDDESHRSALIDLLSQLGSNSAVTSELLQGENALKVFVGILRLSGTMDKYSLVNLFEEILERSADAGDEGGFRKVEGILVDLLKRGFFSPEPRADGEEELAEHTKAMSNAIEVFELTLVLMKTYLRAASLKAGGIEFLVLVSSSDSSTSSSTDVRLAAMSCIAEVYSRVVEDELTPQDVAHLELGSEEKLRLQGFILIPVLDLIGDEGGSISDKAVEILYGRINDEDQAVIQFFWAYDGSLEKLIHKLASSRAAEGGEVAQGQHSLTEWLLSVLINRSKGGVKEAFSSFWGSDAVENSKKRKLVGILPSTLASIQESAKSAGVSFENAGHSG